MVLKKIDRKEYGKKNREKLTEKMRRYRKSHPEYREKEGIDSKKYQLKNIEKRNKYTKKYNYKMRKLIKDRDGCCIVCNLDIVSIHELGRKVAIHPIDHDKSNDLPQNLVTLCNSCHCKTNHNRSHWKKFFQSLLAEWYNYEYTPDGKMIITLERWA